jgi:hypothetical protein
MTDELRIREQITVRVFIRRLLGVTRTSVKEAYAESIETLSLARGNFIRTF